MRSCLDDGTKAVYSEAERRPFVRFYGKHPFDNFNIFLEAPEPFG